VTCIDTSSRPLSAATLAGEDRIVVLGSRPATVRSGAGADSVFTDDGADDVAGEAGDDLVSGGATADSVSGGDGADLVIGGDGADILSGGAGADAYAGGAGDDRVDARDGVAEHVDCGEGADAAVLDITDTPIGCEAVDVAPLASFVTGKFKVGGRATAVKTLTVSDIPAGATVEVRCKGKTCPLKATSKAFAQGVPATSFKSPFGRKPLAPGTRIDALVLRDGIAGVGRQFTLRDGKKPKATPLCVPAGSTTPAAC
jgi:hypothetical protein